MNNDNEYLSQSNQSIIDLEKWQQIADLLAELFNAPTCAIVQLHQHTFNVLKVSNTEKTLLKRDQQWSWEFGGLCRHMLETNSKLYVPDTQCDSRWSNNEAINSDLKRSYLGYPLLWPDGSQFGTLCIIDSAPTNYSSTLQKVLAHFAQLIMSDLKMYKDYQALEELALTDSMTGVYNRRGLTLLGEQKLKDAKRYQSSIGVIYLDIDNLKQVNDTFTHNAGDKCITTLSKVLQRNFRESDLIARVGGDEFIVISQIGSRLELTTIANRIEKCYANTVKGNVQLERSSVSYGTSILDCYSTLPFETLLEEADRNMYQHKHKKNPQKSNRFSD
ncbi:sensor domain-containing diguanylate cyclase [Aliivibrio kagoshimensis]|uniref:sensor domain-containing diguanylate cyclase n=1 Tax=Aliivibrio kagoshimensis TaxID=2910230 RepID=UPI003D0D9C6A